MAESTRSFLIWGAGGHGTVLSDLIRCAGHRVRGYIDRDAGLKEGTGDFGSGLIMIAEEDWVMEMKRRRRTGGVDALALGLGDNGLRFSCFETCAHLDMPPLVHPSAYVSRSALLGEATVVLAGAVINPAARLGRAVIVNSGAVVEHDCFLDDATHVSPGAVLCGTVSVGKRSWIGAAAVVIPNVRIGSDATIGAGAVVIDDVPDGATVVGNPARALHSMSEAVS